MSNQLQENLDIILEEKNTKLLPENLKAGITCLGVTGELEEGIDTSDATATASDIVSGKTAYANGEKITGTVYEVGKDSNMTLDFESMDDFATQEAVCVYSVIPDDYLFRETSRISTPIGYHNVAEAINLQSDQIAKGSTVLGVEGTAEIGGSSDTGVKLFATEEAMKADKTSSEGDLAIIYAEVQAGITETSTFRHAVCPDEVTLPYSIGDEYASVRFEAIDSSGMFDCWGELSQSRFNLECYTDTGMITIEYESYDGITYSKLEGSTEVDFGTEIMFSGSWNDLISYFFLISSVEFRGLYRHDGNAYVLDTAQLTATADHVYNAKYYGKDGVQDGTLGATVSNKFNDPSAEIYAEIQARYDELSSIVLTNSTYKSTFSSDLIMIPSKSDGTPIIDTSALTTTKYMFQSYYDLKMVCPLNTANVTNTFGMFYNCKALTYAPELNYDNVLDAQYMYYGCSSLKSIGDIILPKATNVYRMFLLCSSLETIGVVTMPNVTNAGAMFSSCSSLKSVTITDMSKVTEAKDMFASCDTMVTVDLAGSSAIKNAETMFLSCDNLQTITNFSAGAITNARNMFNGCKSLVETPVLDMPSVTDMYSMFGNCEKLTTVTLTNTSSATNMIFTFSGCVSLVNAPNLNTSSVTSMNRMFSGCSSLVNVPVYDTSKLTSCEDTFNGCEALSDDSLNNIMAMCANSAVVADNQNYFTTLEYIGLTSEQATRCQTLSNYEMFTAAGWTTGY